MVVLLRGRFPRGLPLKFNNDVVYVDSDQLFVECMQNCAQQQAIAIDTEFVRETTYYPIPALIQINDGQYIYIIDPLDISDFGVLAELLTNSNVVKVMHSCSEDFGVFHRLTGAYPVNVFDTQKAEGLVGGDWSLSLLRLIEKYIGIELEKTQTRSDWLKRPLSRNQLAYAIDDVAYLLAIYEKIVEQLKTLERSDWLSQDMHHLAEEIIEAHQAENYYLKFSNAASLPPKARWLLKALVDWREDYARAQDIPRTRILKDRELFSVAERFPHNLKELSQLNLHPSCLRKYGEQIIAFCEQANHAKTTDIPYVKPISNDYQQKVKVAAMKRAVNALAEDLGLQAQVVARKRDIEQYLNESADSVISNTWRGDYLSKKFDDILSG